MEQIEYTRTVVPSSMRSPYWKYFGFPSDNGNNILTRQKIVCTICNSAIAYNKNTSNLRTHIMSKHVEIFRQIVTPNNSTVREQDTFCFQNTEEQIKSTIEIDYVNDNDIKKQRLESHDGVEISTSLQNSNQFVESCLTLTEYGSMQSERSNSSAALTNKIDLEMHSRDYNAYMPSNYSEMVEATECSTEVFDTSNMYAEKDHKAITYSDVDPNADHAQQLHSLEIMLADLIQRDLLPIDTLYEPGFYKYNQQLTGLNIDAEVIKRVQKIIEARFTNIKGIVSSHLQRLSQSQPYSLSFEIYKDYIGQDVLNIYFNYLNDSQVDLISILYANIIVGIKAVNISEILAEVDLKNCSGVVITCLDNMYEFVLDFIKFYELPLIECLESTLSRCLQKIFDQTEFHADYEKFLKIILASGNETHLKKSNCRLRCNWSKLNFLEYIFQNGEQNTLEQWTEFRRSYEYLKPLKVVLNIITEESLPLCSLSRPLIKKIFAEHFNCTNQGESKISKIQTILQKELYERIIAQSFLKEVTYFDSRFHRDFALQEPISDETYFKTRIVKRFKHILQLKHVNEPNNNMNMNKVDDFMNSRKCSSLKSLFKRDVSFANTDHTPDLKTNLDLEFELYNVQACLDLDQSPVLWWQQQTDNYKQLTKIAKYYLSIPCCCVPRLCRIESEQRYSKLDRRKNLSQFCSTESKLWYLHYNEDVVDLLSK